LRVAFIRSAATIHTGLPSSSPISAQVAGYFVQSPCSFLLATGRARLEAARLLYGDGRLPCHVRRAILEHLRRLEPMPDLIRD
jgi:hypothetical protein